MTDTKTESYAVKNGISNKQAKRRLKGRKSDFISVQRGVPVAGTGKPKGGQKT